MNSLSVVGSRANFQVISMMQSKQKQGRKVRLLQLSEDHSALHCWKNPCLCAPKQTGIHHHWRPSTRNSVWVQNQQGYHRHGVHPQAAPREMQGAEQRTVYRIWGSDQSVRYSEQKGTVDDHGAPWLTPKVLQLGYPTAQRPMWPS